eukprot:TRINITY_DN3741_c0_g1_i5.p1 TRINITY_DN3741_c0_g1~~TRINITY_DN3741_c0_g1_i5.p1  ORF type:complete len:543 (+),score=158.28 TRINITY_DN3741_c0_g1_i5:62-1690(+)
MAARSSTGGQDVEGELAELHRRFRIMEGERKSYTETSQSDIRKQRATIEKLKRENEYLKDELSQVESQSVDHSANQSTSVHISKLQENIDALNRKIDAEKARIDELDRHLKLLQDRIMEQKQELGGVTATREAGLAINRQIKILENRLDKALVKFNQALAENKELREQIDSLRRERVVFDNIYKKHEKDLLDQKKEMAGVIEMSNSAYEQRDEAQNRVIQLKEKSDKEIAAFEAEMKELNRIIEQDRKMKDFMKLRENPDKPGSEEKKKKKKGIWEFTNGRAAAQLSMEKVQTYEEGFAKIQAATGISDIDEFVNAFIKVEDQNFSLFNFVNELNNEIEKLEEQISEIRAEIEKYKSQGINSDNQRKKILKDLEERLLRTESKSEQYENKHNQSMRIAGSLKAAIQSIFNRIGCNTSAVIEMLGNQGVTEANMMQYLGIIEQRANEILRSYQAIQTQNQEAASGQQAPGQPSMASLGPAAPPGSLSFYINPPSTNEEEDSDEEEDNEDDDRPLTREELKSKTMRRVCPFLSIPLFLCASVCC